MKKENVVYNCLVSVVEKLMEIDRKIDRMLALNPGLYDHTDVCRIFQISRRTLDHYRELGLVSFCKLGGRIYYRLADINRCIEENTVAGCRRLDQGNKKDSEPKAPR